MNSTVKIVVSIAVMIAGVVIVRQVINLSRDTDPQVAVQKKVDQLKKDGVAKNPNLPVSEAVHQEAVAKASEALKAEPVAEKRKTTAAANFFGFYLINVRERLAFCKEKGVEIAPFVAAFSAGHSGELSKARAILTAKPEFSEAKLYELVQPQLRQMINQDMDDIARTQKTSVADACQWIADNGAALAEQMHISKVQPMVFRELMQ